MSNASRSSEVTRQSTASVVTVQEMGGSAQSIPFVEGQTAGRYLQEAGIRLKRGRAINLNGRSASRRDVVPSAGATITIAKAAVNG